MPFALHFEEIGCERAEQAAILTHGLLGAGRNLRSLARAVVDRRPGFGLVLVDLREHGRSVGALPPHTIAAAAGDLVALGRRIATGGLGLSALIGHSLGGKAVLLARRELQVAQTWVLDSSLSVVAPPYRGSDTIKVVEALEDIGAARYATREDFISDIVSRGFSRALASWLATNLELGADDRYVFARDMAAIRALLESYFETDGWPLLEPRPDEEVHVVLGTRSNIHSSGDRARLSAMASDLPGFFVHEVDAGHWLHSERKDELAAILAQFLPSSR